MSIVNRWQDEVSDSVFNRLESWIEYYIGQYSRSPCLPMYCERWVFTPFENRLGHKCYRVERLEGPELMPPPSGVRDFATISDFTVAFRSISDTQQILIMSYADPFDIFPDRQSIDVCLKQIHIPSARYMDHLGRSFVSLQDKLADRGIVRRIMKGEIRTWKKIAERFHRSVPTVMAYARLDDLPLPIRWDGNTVFILEEEAARWERSYLKSRPAYSSRSRSRYISGE